MTPAQQRRRRVAEAAARFGGVQSQDPLRCLGVDSHVVAREVMAERWALPGLRTVAMHTGPLDELALRWRAVWEVGCGATLDGASAMQSAGMRGFATEVVHVSVSRAARPTPVPGVRIDRVDRLRDETVSAGPPRARSDVAAVRAARWAGSDRQAALLLVMPVQQRLVRPQALVRAAERVPGRSRRALVDRLVRDIADGAQSQGELDFARACRRRGLPPPDRQVVVTTPRGRVYLDVRWSSIGLVVEIDGAGHLWGLAPAADSLRQNAVTLGADMVLRIDLIGWRLQPDAYLDQVGAAHTLLAARRAA